MTVTASDQRRRQVEAAAQEWRSSLIDVSGNNRLLYFKRTGATLDLAEASPAAVAELLSGETVRLPQLFNDPIRFTAAQKACKSLAAKQREAREEYGVTVAFCAMGLATWDRTAGDAIERESVDEVDEATGEAKPVGDEHSSTDVGDPADAPRKREAPRSGRPLTPPAAPVLLRAVELTARSGTTDAWELTLSGDAQLNPVLAHVLAAQGIFIDEQAVLEAGDDTRGELTPVFDQVRKACAAVEGFRIDDALLVGPFSYLKQPMVADCEDIDAMIGSDLVAALAGDAGALGSIRSIASEVSESDPDYKPVDSEFLVLDADGSQSYVVNAALAGRNLVIQGPPGTGKSQTIANVIAGLIANGKHVLFVAQKRAAITAVLDRLEQVGLGELTLDLFAAGASRRYVADELRTVLDRQATVGAPVTTALHQRLTSSRDRLVSHRNAMHVRKHAWGVTLGELLAMAYGISATVDPGLRISIDTLSSWGPDDLDSFAESLDELDAKGGLTPDRLTRPGWSPVALTSSDLVSQANQTLVRINSQLLPEVRATLDTLRDELGVALPQTLDESQHLIDKLARAAEVIDLIPGTVASSFGPDSLERLLAATDKSYRRSNAIQLSWTERRSARKEVQTLLTDSARTSGLSPHELLGRAKVVRAEWADLDASGSIRVAMTLKPARAALLTLRQHLSDLQRFVQGDQLDGGNITDLEELLARLGADRDRAQLPRLHEIESTLTAAGLGTLLAAWRRLSPDDQTRFREGSDGFGNLLRVVAVRSALDHVFTTDPALAGVNGADLTRATSTFQRTDAEHLEANAARIRRAAAARLNQVLDEFTAEHILVTKEITKRRNFRPIRRLFEDAPNVMTAAKPCWAMSPLQVSRLLPATPCFDVVIFDEASQVKPADGIPALIRAPQAIVAGDSRQLPPTEFFTKVLEDVPPAPPTGSSASADEEDLLAAEAAAEDAELDGEFAAEPAPPPVGESLTKDAESILFAFERALAGQSRRLLWHYRSRDERLIAVSNAFVYDWSLTTFPASDGEDCVRHVAVEPSAGIKGGANSPQAEVEAVVALVLEHARTRPEETLGVITFGIPHTRRVQAAVEAAFEAAPELEQALNTNERESFFVKNIERVQGDERDSIILSVGYGKGLDGKLRLFWGPLLQPGGERRLNVAISRARAHMTLVTSFAADDVAEDAHPSAGFQLMYRFLRFMASGGRDLSNDGRRAVALNPFEIDVRDQLAREGLDLVPQLGVGRYRLDFAVRHPEHPGRYVLAIEADGASYHAGLVARERDRLRQRLLEARGWRFHRIWSTDWFNDAECEVKKVLDSYRDALGSPTRQSSTATEPRLRDSEQIADAEPFWHIASATRTYPRPRFVARLGIDSYDAALLVNVILHIRSDGVIRTRDQEMLEVMHELGFAKRGSKIVMAIEHAQRTADSHLA